MPIQLNFVGQNAAEVAGHLTDFYRLLDASRITPASAPVEVSPADPMAEKPIEAPSEPAGRRKPGRPKAAAAPDVQVATEAKSEVIGQVKHPAQTIEGEAVERQIDYTVDDVRGALKRLGAAEGHGHGAVFEVLGEFGAKNATEVFAAGNAAKAIDAVNTRLGAAS